MSRIFTMDRPRTNMLLCIGGVLCFLLLVGKCERSNEEGLKIPLASIFDRNDRQSIAAFRYAQSNFNSISTNPFTLMSYIDKDVDITDSFSLASKMCDRMAAGVFLFYGVKNMMSLDIVQSFTKTFQMPYLSPSTPIWSDRPGPSYEVHLKPEYSYAIIEMIIHYGWQKIHYVYDSDEGLRHLQQVLNVLNNVGGHREADTLLDVNVLARRIYNIEHAHDELRQLDRMESEQYVNKVIVFDLSSEDAYRHILRQIPEVGMNKEGYHYLVATLDFMNLDMGRYLHGGVNITGFQLLDFESPSVKKFMDIWEHLDLATYPGASDKRLTYEAALAVDAIEVITRALKGMVSSNSKIFQSTFRRKEVYNYNKTKGIPCSTNPIPWMHGNDIMEEIKRLDFEGLTGRIKFDEMAYRAEYKLYVYTVGLDRGPTKIGHWTRRHRFRSDDYIPKPEDLEPKLLPYRKAVSIISKPFLMYADPDPSGNPLIGNARYQGYVKDLAKKITDKTNIEFNFFLVPDGNYGSFDEDNRTWDGMVGVLTRHDYKDLEQPTTKHSVESWFADIYQQTRVNVAIENLVFNVKEADICIAPLTITYKRESYVDFTKPYMNFGISIMIKKPEITKPGVFSFMEPLEPRIWIFIVLAYCAVSGGLFLVCRFSPYEWTSSPENCQLENTFNILNALWFSVGALMLQGNDACPRSFSGRVIGTVWWFFVLIIISSYTANLAAFLTIERMQTPIESADDLSMQTEIKYGTLASGTTNEFFQNAKVPVYERMKNFMNANPDVMVDNVTAGIERVQKSKGKYAFLLESPTNEYVNNREPCDTIKVGPNLNSKGHGIATPKGSPLRGQVNLAVLQLMEDGTLLKLKTKWWKDKGVCAGNDGKDSKKRELSLSNVAGIFYILVGGLAVSVVLASIEFICSKSKFMEHTTYIKATETVTTFLPTPTVERENGGFGTEHTNNSVNNISNNSAAHADKEEFTYNYSASPPPYIGFEQFTAGEVHENAGSHYT